MITPGPPPDTARSASPNPVGARRLGMWTRSLPALEALLGADEWHRRAEQLIAGVTRSPYQAKIVEDYHWVELELALQLDTFRRNGYLAVGELSVRTRAALEFAVAVVRLHEALTERGKRILHGRLRDGLNKGFAGLFLEVDTAAQLIEGGYDVRYPDFDGSGNHDLDAVIHNVSIAIECKSLSADAGRKIHRRHFYRFMDLLQPKGMPSTSVTRSVAVVVTVTDRFPSACPAQDEIARQVRELFRAPPDTQRSGRAFSVATEPFETADLATGTVNMDATALRARWGENAHIAGVSVDGQWNLVVVRSRREDDTFSRGTGCAEGSGQTTADGAARHRGTPVRGDYSARPMQTGLPPPAFHTRCRNVPGPASGTRRWRLPLRLRRAMAARRPAGQTSSIHMAIRRARCPHAATTRRLH